MSRAALVILLLGACPAFLACRRAAQEALTTPVVSPSPTQILKDFEMNDLRHSVKTMTLRSIEARIYDEQKYAELEKPIVLFYQEGRVSSQMSAPSGKVQTETHVVEAWGGVSVVSSDSSTLTTERMRYDPETRKIRSEDPVRLEKQDSITEGIGLETDPELQRVKIGRQKVRFKKGLQP